jgi:hypothetical protein
MLRPFPKLKRYSASILLLLLVLASGSWAVMVSSDGTASSACTSCPGVAAFTPTLKWPGVPVGKTVAGIGVVVGVSQITKKSKIQYNIQIFTGSNTQNDKHTHHHYEYHQQQQQQQQ